MHVDSPDGPDARRQPLRMTAAAYSRLRRSVDQMDEAAANESEDLMDAHADIGAVLDARRARSLRDALDAAVVVIPDGSVIVGVDVVLRDDRQLVTYALVPPGRGNPDVTNLLSADSPLGRALLGHRSGDRVVVAAPSGQRVVEIVEIR